MKITLTQLKSLIREAVKVALKENNIRKVIDVQNSINGFTKIIKFDDNSMVTFNGNVALDIVSKNFTTESIKDIINLNDVKYIFLSIGSISNLAGIDKITLLNVENGTYIDTNCQLPKFIDLCIFDANTTGTESDIIKLIRSNNTKIGTLMSGYVNLDLKYSMKGVALHDLEDINIENEDEVYIRSTIFTDKYWNVLKSKAKKVRFKSLEKVNEFIQHGHN